MKLLKSIALAALFGVAAISMPACSTIARITNHQSVATYDEKALITAELAYSFVLGTALDAAHSGAINAQQAQQLLPILQQAQANAQRARAAYDAGNSLDASIATQDLIGEIAAVTNLLTQFGVLHPQPASAG